MRNPRHRYASTALVSLTVAISPRSLVLQDKHSPGSRSMEVPLEVLVAGERRGRLDDDVYCFPKSRYFPYYACIYPRKFH